ncbi:hypothetical protein L6452_32993 [Arctium lappa]|uniref:Uncharacterized protein n=1 Tax=Arctium lappa TaxID=4217 RepID=A0ACB8Z6I1_ARCLA|nr:hypothetical protein L6452_32993 [Arctium lappa]
MRRHLAGKNPIANASEDLELYLLSVGNEKDLDSDDEKEEEGIVVEDEAQWKKLRHCSKQTILLWRRDHNLGQPSYGRPNCASMLVVGSRLVELLHNHKTRKRGFALWTYGESYDLPIVLREVPRPIFLLQPLNFS